MNTMSGRASRPSGSVLPRTDLLENDVTFKRLQAKIMAVRRECEALVREKTRRAELQRDRRRYETGYERKWNDLNSAWQVVLAGLRTLRSDGMDLQGIWQDHLSTKSPLNFETYDDRLAAWRRSCGDSLNKCRDCGQRLNAFARECQQAGLGAFQDRVRDMLAYISAQERDFMNQMEDVQALQDGLGRALAEQMRDQVFECPICMCENSLEDVFTMSKCGHQLCRGCTQHTVRNDLNCGLLPLVCPQCKADPCDQCPIKMHAGEEGLTVKHCQLEEGDLTIVLSQEDLERYYRAQMTIAVNSSNETLVRCPANDCFNIIGKEQHETHCACNVCMYEWCSACHVDWHKDSTCEEYQQWKVDNERADEDMEKLKAEGKVKECPNCHQWGLRGSGECNATWCLHCKGTFCWLCGISLSHIRNPHNHFAEPGPCYEKLFEGVH
ncbi:hypothetical protein BSKO_13056 [Bryopsis sp. KO-2023]|nr:hypothetical protein BSKO_13056 [Bryopsis sp. KO-2023]